MDTFDVDVFISDVEARPAVWDLRSNEYSDRGKKNQAWEELCLSTKMRYADEYYRLSERTSVITASLICLLYSYIDKQLERTELRCSLQLEVNSFRSFIHTLFQVANIMSLLGATMESPTLLKLSLWYMLAFVVMALVTSLLEFVMRLVLDGSLTIMEFVSEVALFFVMCQCLPIFENFRRRLE